MITTTLTISYLLQILSETRVLVTIIDVLKVATTYSSCNYIEYWLYNIQSSGPQNYAVYSFAQCLIECTHHGQVQILSKL